VIHFDRVGFRFPGKPNAPPVLADFELTIARGEFHLLLGPSGCGKTTALNLLAGFEQATQGMITVDGRAISAPAVDRIVIFQGDDSLFPWLTALENIEFGLRLQGIPASARRAKAREYLALVGLEGHAEKFPEELSGGMKQRIQIARALVCDSPILLMDEPFAAVDSQTRAMLQAELSLIWQRTGCTIFFITHDIAESIVLADRVSVMHAGPGSRIKETVTIEMPRPRSPASPHFAEYYARISGILAGEVRRAASQDIPTMAGPSQ
jgi:NitT/TauT family transport system ATP-binding protein